MYRKGCIFHIIINPFKCERKNLKDPTEITITGIKDPIKISRYSYFGFYFKNEIYIERSIGFLKKFKLKYIGKEEFDEFMENFLCDIPSNSL